MASPFLVCGLARISLPRRGDSFLGHTALAVAPGSPPVGEREVVTVSLVVLVQLPASLVRGGRCIDHVHHAFPERTRFDQAHRDLVVRVPEQTISRTEHYRVDYEAQLVDQPHLRGHVPSLRQTATRQTRSS